MLTYTGKRIFLIPGASLRRASSASAIRRALTWRIVRRDLPIPPAGIGSLLLAEAPFLAALALVALALWAIFRAPTASAAPAEPEPNPAAH